jgi:ATP-dependent 26S proteasome regulatory subunit
MPKSTKKPQSLLESLADKSIPVEQRYVLLRTMVNDPNLEPTMAIHALLETFNHGNEESQYREKLKELEETLHLMRSGPMRDATFIKLVAIVELPMPQALVVLDDGTQAYTTVPDAALAQALRRGDRVILEGKGRALLSKAPEELKIGEEAQYERRIDGQYVEVTVRGQERLVFVASETLCEQLDAGQVQPGASLIVNARKFVAMHALPPQDGVSHYRHLVKSPPPAINVQKDIGSPPAFIEELATLLHLEMTAPDIRRRYRLRRCITKLLSGVSGSGKTLAIHGFWRRMYEVMSEVTGAPIEALPYRVFKLRLSQVLSMWFGESDKNVDRFFQEVEEMAEQKFTYDGREFTLPVLVILEEVDGVARARGQDGIYDRVLTTLLQRLDSTREDLSKKLIIFIGTTNEPGAVDRAFLRRVGGTVEHFGRLGKRGFAAVLEKHLDGLPLASRNGCTAQQIRRRLIADLTAWLFSPNGSDKGIIELTYAGSTTPDVRYRRDLLTGSLVDRAVQQACAEAVEIERQGADRPGLSLEMLMKALDRQCRAGADQINENTARHYLELPDGVRVATVRRVPQPAPLPIELQRNENQTH